jgi:hypothetical protein
MADGEHRLPQLLLGEIREEIRLILDSIRGGHELHMVRIAVAGVRDSDPARKCCTFMRTNPRNCKTDDKAYLA